MNKLASIDNQLANLSPTSKEYKNLYKERGKASANARKAHDAVKKSNGDTINDFRNAFEEHKESKQKAPGDATATGTEEKIDTVVNPVVTPEPVKLTIEEKKIKRRAIRDKAVTNINQANTKRKTKAQELTNNYTKKIQNAHPDNRQKLFDEHTSERAKLESNSTVEIDKIAISAIESRYRGKKQARKVEEYKAAISKARKNQEYKAASGTVQPVAPDKNATAPDVAPQQTKAELKKAKQEAKKTEKAESRAKLLTTDQMKAKQETEKKALVKINEIDVKLLSVKEGSLEQKKLLAERENQIAIRTEAVEQIRTSTEARQKLSKLKQNKLIKREVRLKEKGKSLSKSNKERLIKHQTYIANSKRIDESLNTKIGNAPKEVNPLSQKQLMKMQKKLSKKINRQDKREIEIASILAKEKNTPAREAKIEALKTKMREKGNTIAKLTKNIDKSQKEAQVVSRTKLGLAESKKALYTHTKNTKKVTEANRKISKHREAYTKSGGIINTTRLVVNGRYTEGSTQKQKNTEGVSSLKTHTPEERKKIEETNIKEIEMKKIEINKEIDRKWEKLQANKQKNKDAVEFIAKNEEQIASKAKRLKELADLKKRLEINLEEDLLNPHFSKHIIDNIKSDINELAEKERELTPEYNKLSEKLEESRVIVKYNKLLESEISDSKAKMSYLPIIVTEKQKKEIQEQRKTDALKILKLQYENESKEDLTKKLEEITKLPEFVKGEEAKKELEEFDKKYYNTEEKRHKIEEELKILESNPSSSKEKISELKKESKELSDESQRISSSIKRIGKDVENFELKKVELDYIQSKLDPQPVTPPVTPSEIKPGTNASAIPKKAQAGPEGDSSLKKHTPEEIEKIEETIIKENEQKKTQIGAEIMRRQALLEEHEEKNKTALKVIAFNEERFASNAEILRSNKKTLESYLADAADITSGKSARTGDVEYHNELKSKINNLVKEQSDLTKEQNYLTKELAERRVIVKYNTLLESELRKSKEELSSLPIIVTKKQKKELQEKRKAEILEYSKRQYADYRKEDLIILAENITKSLEGEERVKKQLEELDKTYYNTEEKRHQIEEELKILKSKSSYSYNGSIKEISELKKESRELSRKLASISNRRQNLGEYVENFEEKRVELDYIQSKLDPPPVTPPVTPSEIKPGTTGAPVGITQSSVPRAAGTTGSPTLKRAQAGPVVPKTKLKQLEESPEARAAHLNEVIATRNAEKKQRALSGIKLTSEQKKEEKLMNLGISAAKIGIEMEKKGKTELSAMQTLRMLPIAARIRSSLTPEEIAQIINRQIPKSLEPIVEKTGLNVQELEQLMRRL